MFVEILHRKTKNVVAIGNFKAGESLTYINDWVKRHNETIDRWHSIGHATVFRTENYFIRFLQK